MLTFSPPLPPPAPGLVAGRAVWAQFAFPVTVGFPDGNNQGSLVVFNLNSDVTIGKLKQVFEPFGKKLILDNRFNDLLVCNNCLEI